MALRTLSGVRRTCAPPISHPEPQWGHCAPATAALERGAYAQRAAGEQDAAIRTARKALMRIEEHIDANEWEPAARQENPRPATSCARFRRNRVCCAKPTRAPPALWIRTKAGGAWSPAVAATGRTVGGLSEGRAGKQRDQRESSDKCLHDTSPGLDHRHRFVHQRRGRSAGACNPPSPSLDREKQCLFPGSLTSDVLSARPHDSLDRSKPTSFGLSRPRLHL